MKSISITYLFFILISSAYSSDEICSDLSGCREIEEKILRQIKNVYLRDIGKHINTIARKEDGSVLNLTQKAAEKYCASLGAGFRLPTVLELALYAQSRGSCPVLFEAEFKQFKETDNCKKHEYQFIEVEDTQIERGHSFYVNHRGYQSPGGDYGLSSFRSSSVQKFYPYTLTTINYALEGGSGFINGLYAEAFHEFPVRCYNPKP